MKTLNTRFGEVAYDPENVLTFPEGLIGFENLRQFIVMPNQKDGPLFWIQSVEDPSVALILTDPTNFFLGYQVVPEAGEKKKLQLAAEEDCFTLVVVTVYPDRQVTLNLMAPILFAPGSNKAIQVILENSDYSVQTPLPVVEKG